jgi:hypothetical protein
VNDGWLSHLPLRPALADTAYRSRRYGLVGMA